MHGPVCVTVLPCEYRLSQNCPNPFREKTTITLNLKADGHVRLLVHNLAGEQVTALVDLPLERGVHKIEWDGRNSAGHDMPSGTYTYTVEVNDFRSTRTMALNR
jgi:flagellar hook assembly protein FlgD